MILAAPQPLKRIASAAPHPLARIGRPRLKPRIALLCMAFDRPQQARVELRIEAPLAAAGWIIRRIETNAPILAGLSRRADGPTQSGLDVTLSASRDGARFSSDATVWLRYRLNAAPVHRISLRLLVDDAEGRRRSLTVSAVFPAMTWAASNPPRGQRRAAPSVRPAPRRRLLPVETKMRVDPRGPAPSSLH
jgi:hypothetical protein